MNTLGTFCRAVEATAGLAAVRAQWRAALGGDDGGGAWPWAAALLRATDELAAAYPRLEPDPPSPRPYRVVCHDAAADDYVGVCPDGTGRIALRAADLVVYELDVGGVAARVVAALGLVADFERIAGLAHAYRVGFLNPLGGGGAGGEAWAYLAVPGRPAQLEAALASLVLRHTEPFLLLTPTRSAWRAWPEPLRHRGAVAALADVLRVDGATGAFHAAAGAAAGLLGPVWRAIGGGGPAARPDAGVPGPIPHVGFLRVEDVRAAYPDLEDRQVDRVRKALEAWRQLHEDDVLMGEESPPCSGRRRYAYPAAAVADAVAAVLARAAGRRRDR